jgi:cytoskeletal protein CcmA (bactofilin family)
MKTPFVPRIEQLESRQIPALYGPVLEIGVRESFTFLDRDGDAIRLQLHGQAGQVVVRENSTDRAGDNDGILENGEILGSLTITQASTDFWVEVVHEDAVGRGNGDIRIGKVIAEGQTIRGLFVTPGSLGPSSFELEGYRGKGFSAGGGLRVNRLLALRSEDGIVLDNFAASNEIFVTGRVEGKVVVANDLQGTLRTNSSWLGSVWVGGNVGESAEWVVGQNSTGRLIVAGDFAGTVAVTGTIGGNWTIVGDVLSSAQISSGGQIARLQVVGDVAGNLAAASRIRLTVGGAILASAEIQARTLQVQVDGDLAGDLSGAGSHRIATQGKVRRTATLEAGGILQVKAAGGLERGAVLRGNRVRFARTGPTPNGIPVGSLPLTITSPGYYYLTTDLYYGSVTGHAIEIRADNVTLDLNGHDLIGTVGARSEATGIRADGHSYIRIHNGTITGFRIGVQIDGSEVSGIIVENLKLTAWYLGIEVDARYSWVRNNRVLEVGGSLVPNDLIPIAIRLFGIRARGTDNIVAGVRRSSINREWVGFHFDAAPAARAERNIVVNSRALYRTWGAWINMGSAAQGGFTDILFVDNLFSRLERGVQYSYARGQHTSNVVLNTEYAFVRGRDLGGNITI